MLPGVWDEIEEEVLGCITCGRSMSPGEIGAKLGMSEEAATSLLCLLALDRKVRISLVSVDEPIADADVPFEDYRSA